MTKKAPPSPTKQPGKIPKSAPSDAKKAKEAGEIAAADIRARLRQKRMSKDELGRSREGLDNVNAEERESIFGEIARQEADLDKPETEQGTVTPQRPSGKKLKQ